MGTASEWVRVLLLGAFWGAGMWWWGGIAKRKTFPRLPNFVSLVFASLAFGMLVEFGWRRVFQGGIAVIFVVALFAVLVANVAVWHARKRGN